MGRQGGQGKGKPGRHDRSAGLGQALLKMHMRGESTKRSERYQTTMGMKSILDNTALDDFIDTTDMMGEEPEVQRVHQNHAFLTEATTHKSIQQLTFSAFDAEQLSIPRKPAWNREMTAEDVDRNEKGAFLRWRREIDLIESADDYTKKVTPFEKNLEVWRQLWRVCERSDLMIQIVDARNPLLYYTRDLMRYVADLQPSRSMMLLLNKADFLTEYQRLKWARYLTKRGIRFAFYSAYVEQSKLDAGVEEDEVVDETLIRQLATDIAKGVVDMGGMVDEEEMEMEEVAQEVEVEVVLKAVEEEEEEEEEESDEEEGSDEEEEEEGGSEEEGTPVLVVEEDVDVDVDVDVDDDRLATLTARRKVEEPEDEDEEEEEEEEESVEEEVTQKPILAHKATSGGSGSRQRAWAHVLNRHELTLLLSLVSDELGLEANPKSDGRVCVGLVGYPNVGKSSCINTLLGVSKSSHGKVRVAVSSTPGKTKHFQTLILNDEIVLCDCPGLVFPSFMRSTGEMLCAGILPINQMRDYQEPAAVVASRVPQYLLEAALGISIYRHLDPLDKADRPPTPAEVLGAYCESRGLVTNGTGRWDEFKACKDLLKMFNDGQLVHVALPPEGEEGEGGVRTEGVGSAETGGTGGGDDTKLQQRWIHETERTMARKRKVADRVEEQQTKTKAKIKAAAAAAVAVAQMELERGDFVFGDGFTNTPAVTLLDANGYEFCDDSDSDDDTQTQTQTEGGASASVSASVGGAKPRREHKRLQTWGKKNKKLRNKNPYGEDAETSAMMAYSTSRPAFVGSGGVAGQVGGKLVRHGVSQAYGTAFVRAVLPHHTPANTMSRVSGQEAEKAQT
ncbi:hypothetical protein B484DRAFT_449656 [Ochromonadaceae sp. CCMP2298]|nr:hypothetical protein B484DRAFT_449656 [Ochromonadaceae sp. CCMP2298]